MRGDRSAMRVTRGMHLEAKIGDDAWRAGEVVWGNGHSYVLRWFDGGPDSGRIPRAGVRPLPDPTVKLPADLAAGDVLDVFHSNLWKRAVVVGAAAHGQFDVKIADSAEVLAADLSVLRPRMVYEGGEKGWVVIHKGNKIPVESAVPWRPVAGKNTKASGNGGGKFAAAHATNLNLGKTKRSNYAVDADIVRDVKRFQGNVFLAKKEPAARYNDNNNIEVMDVHPSHYLKKREQQETSNHHNKPNNEEIDVVGGTDSDSTDDDSSSKSDASSSSDGDSSGGSSNGSNGNSEGGARAVPTIGEHCQENQEVQSPPSCKEEEQDSDERTESRASAGTRHRPAEEEEEQNQQVDEHDHRVHGLELEAYVSVMKAFFFTGPLTWAKEELLSDLRLQLHVSSDEHLQAIRRLKGKK